MQRDKARQVIYQITSILQSLRLYPVEHPQVQRQLEQSLEKLTPLICEQQKLSIGLVDGTLLINDTPCLERVTALQELIRLLERQQLQALEIFPGLTTAELLFFCQELPQLLGGEFPERLRQAGIRSIRATLQDDDANTPVEVYRKALETIEDVCGDVRLGRIPSSRKVINTVKEMCQSIIEEPFPLLAMSMLKDYDNYTFTHSVNVAVIAMTVGQACGLDEAELHTLGIGGLLHDLGKMTIDHRIVAKPGRLSTEEFEIMRQHPVNGARIVAEMEQMSPAIIDIVNYHHLRFDRTGYPAIDQASSINHLADMAGIADTFDAMTTIRCYQRPRSPHKAMRMMAELSGNQLHPEYLAAFLKHLGPYPVGTLVRLKDGSIGVICDQDRPTVGSLTLKTIFTPQGEKLLEPPLRQLPDHHNIVAEVDPVLKGVRLEDYLP